MRKPTTKLLAQPSIPSTITYMQLRLQLIVHGTGTLQITAQLPCCCRRIVLSLLCCVSQTLSLRV